MAALRAFGGVERVREECRDMRGVSWADTLRRNLRGATRLIRRQPGYALSVIGTLGLAALVAVTRVPVTLDATWGRSAWWHWSGGLLGAVYIVGTIVLAPRLGAATLIAGLVAGQMAASLIVDHFGWVGFAEHQITPLRLAGALLIVLGVVLVRR